eukprot:6179020-Pleurochrysis_carterae.AAC.1
MHRPAFKILRGILQSIDAAVASARLNARPQRVEQRMHTRARRLACARAHACARTPLGSRRSQSLPFRQALWDQRNDPDLPAEIEPMVVPLITNVSDETCAERRTHRARSDWFRRH